ncbi:alpha/beta-hydrolase [Dacryopinax primogenitus]|uniref:Alpha/beta-hydrolase n=1 Tax=Dacryopinax primogenitus (strain DJM 731) TaxID=1858805 RepID=M5G2Z3_DACPD|nr:alpha/beta-hydrolase [Dacryopinax primogenitus]EJU00197.1 alpha/beta-hydrolase [Dacryopinax primogenitus]
MAGPRVQRWRLLYLFLFILCFPITIPLSVSLIVPLLAADALARRLSLATYSRPPPLTQFRERLKSGLYALRWLLQAVDFVPTMLYALKLVIWDVFDLRSGMRERRHISNVPVDIYLATPTASDKEKSCPIVVFIHDGNYGPIVCRKWMMAPIACKLQRIGCTVIMPEVDPTKKEDMEVIIRNLKLVLAWTNTHAAEIHGDADEIYVMGHGFGAYLALLLSVQMAAVRSRNDYQLHNPDYQTSQDHDDGLAAHHHEVVLPNGLMEARIYAPDVSSVTIKGLILIAPISDTQKHLEWEATQGVSYLSPMRQILGRSCLFHSPAHLLFAARSILNVQYLPSKLLVLHGAQDMVVRSSQSDMLEELLMGAGLQTVQKRLYPKLDHMALLKGIEDDGVANKSSVVLDDVIGFMTSSD